ncbi:MAG: UDP-N-acetylmuramate--L-alanine ligase [Gemmataceae bacterium]|nr:UDP-N-acetylmuramate--L-alanine ligase [Gemmataceae bacterium]
MSAAIRLNLSTPRHLHVIGAGGAAMSAIAYIARQLGHSVSGSDQVPSATLDRLRAAGCDVWSPHDTSRLSPHIDLVAISMAVRQDNPELLALRDRSVDVVTRADMMETFGALKRTVAVSGTAGKTTTTAMLAIIADAAGWRPSFIVGSNILGFGPGMAWTDSDWLIVEADESDASFLRFGAEAVIVNNIAPDHLDFWGSGEALEAGFDAFVTQAAGPKVVNVDDHGVAALQARIGKPPGLVTFGFAANADYRIEDYSAQGLTSKFRLRCGNTFVAEVALAVPGTHNAANAGAALVMAIQLGIAPSLAAQALGRFHGTARRFEQRGSARGVTFVDDYAHLPIKARAAVNAALLGGWSRVIAVFQPHRYSRTRALWRDFADAFTGVDLLVVTAIYAAGEPPMEGVSGRLVIDSVSAAHPEQRICYCESRTELVELLEQELRPGDLCLAMSAGDLTTLPDEMMSRPWARDET